MSRPMKLFAIPCLAAMTRGEEGAPVTPGTSLRVRRPPRGDDTREHHVPSGSERGEPDPDLAGGRLLGVRAVHEVLLDLEAPVAAEVAPYGAGRCDGRVGGAGDRAEALDAPLTLEHHGHHGAG